MNSHEQSVRRKYFLGIKENLELIRKFYPGWTMRLYYQVNEYQGDVMKQLCELACNNMELDICDATANSKLFGAVEWFTRTTKDQLLNVTVPVPPNLVSTTLLNIGELTNSGVEVTANYNLVDNSSFSWTTGVNFGTASSKLNKLTLGTGDDKLSLIHI